MNLDDYNVDAETKALLSPKIIGPEEKALMKILLIILVISGILMAFGWHRYKAIQREVTEYENWQALYGEEYRAYKEQAAKAALQRKLNPNAGFEDEFASPVSTIGLLKTGER